MRLGRARATGGLLLPGPSRRTPCPGRALMATVQAPAILGSPAEPGPQLNCPAPGAPSTRLRGHFTARVAIRLRCTFWGRSVQRLAHQANEGPASCFGRMGSPRTGGEGALWPASPSPPLRSAQGSWPKPLLVEGPGPPRTRSAHLGVLSGLTRQAPAKRRSKARQGLAWAAEEGPSGARSCLGGQRTSTPGLTVRPRGPRGEGCLGGFPACVGRRPLGPWPAVHKAGLESARWVQGRAGSRLCVHEDAAGHVGLGAAGSRGHREQEGGATRA